MSVLIKGMEMPKSCWECPLLIVDDNHNLKMKMCSITRTHAYDTEGRLSDCPLEVQDQSMEQEGEAYNMAISALQKNSTESSSTHKALDTISRQAAIDAPFKKFDMATGVTWIPLEYIEQLPSAQPELCNADNTWGELSKVYNMDDVPETAKEIIGDVMLNLHDSEQFRCPKCQYRDLPECEDLVSRNAVKSLLCKETCHPGAFCPDGFCKEICEKVDALPSVTPKQRTGEWIPVSEGLPKSKPEDLEYPTVIACCEDGEVMTACYYESTKEWGTGENYDKKINPVAWMPLPSPYREDGGE